MYTESITEDMKKKVLRAYNEQLHTQYRYTGGNMVWAGKLLAAAHDVASAVNTVRSAIAWYKAKDQTIPVPPALFLLLAEDMKRSGGVQVKYNPSTEPWTPGSAERFKQQPVEHKEEKPMATQQNSTQVTNAGINLLSGMVVEMLKQLEGGDFQDLLLKKATEAADEYIRNTYGPIQRKTTIVVGDKAKEVKGVVHAKFGEVLNYMANSEPIYLAGPAGTGKNYLAQQIAEVMGWDFYYTNCVTQEYQLSGFTDAMGKYQPTQLYKALTSEKPCVFFLDELDASIPEVLVKLNSAIANGYYDFPAPVGMVKFDRDNVKFVAAGNTTGQGADQQYVARCQLDAASMNRFGVEVVDYDPRIEVAMAQNDENLVGFIRAYRKATKDAGINTVATYRDISRIAKLKPAIELKSLLQSALIKGLDKQDLRTIKDKVQGFGEYSTAFNALC